MHRSPRRAPVVSVLSRLSFLFLLSIALVSIVLGGCAGAPVQEGAAAPSSVVDTRDPLEGFNRAMYTFNDVFDRYLLKPVAQGYRFITPDIVRTGIANFYSNLREPMTMVNNLLQGKVLEGTSDLGRVVVNTTIGIGGLFDVATHFGLEKHEEDFGQTLGVWGVGEGPYLVLPILGPSNLRDGFGEIPDYYLYPTTYLDDQRVVWALFAGRMINRRSQLLEASDILDQAAGQDPYVFIREAYRQRRIHQIYDGNPPAPAPDPSLFEDEPAPAKPN
jgi:phospholipid-binding lipoprotein MlaA